MGTDSKKVVPINLPSRHHEELKRIARESDRSVSSIVRGLVADHLKRSRASKPGRQETK